MFFILFLCQSMSFLLSGLLQGAFARNKVEGFALIKGSGILALVPALVVLETFQEACSIYWAYFLILGNQGHASQTHAQLKTVPI